MFVVWPASEVVAHQDPKLVMKAEQQQQEDEGVALLQAVNRVASVIKQPRPTTS